MFIETKDWSSFLTGERVLNYGTENMATMIVVNSHLETLTAALKNFLSLSAPYKHLIYAGHFFSGNGAWVLQDDTFSISNFAEMCKDKELEEAMKQQNGGQLHFYFSKGGEWKADSLKKLDIFKNTVITVSTDEKAIDNVHGLLQFTAYIASFINAKTSEDLLRTSDVVGNIRFNKPTLYIFPGSEGDSSLFGVSGFNLLINGGYSRKACFWDLTRHLDRIDSFLMTHLGTDNVFGISTLLKRKSTEYIHPEIGYMYLNGSDKVSHSAVVNGQAEKEPNLCINLSEEGSRLIEYAKQLGHVPQPCTRPVTTQPLQPINLYHKVGHGSLNMYVLNPVSDSKELKDFYQHWNKHLSEHGSLHQIPIQNQLSVCTLLVWQPSDVNEKITRIFFPGNAPQYKILEGLEKMKHLDILKHASCTAKDLEHKPPGAAAKRNSLAARPAPSKPPMRSNEPTKSARPTSDIKKSTEIKSSTERKTTEVRSSTERKTTEVRSTTERKSTQVRASTEHKKPEPKKEEVKSAPPPKPRVPTAASLSSRTNKVTKEDENKKMAKKDDKTSKPTKGAPAASKPAAKTKTETKPKKETTAKAVPEKTPEKTEEKSAEKDVKKQVVEEVPKIEEPPVAVVEPLQEKSLLDLSPTEPVVGTKLISETEDKPIGEKHESPEPLPNPSDEYNQPSPTLPEQDLMGMGSNMMESYHEGYNGDLMSNGTPTEQQGQILNNFSEYDNNVDIQPEALPEPVEYSPQEAFSQPDMIPISDRRSQEEKPLISGMAPIEPDVVQGLQYEQEPFDTAAKTSTPLDDKPPMEFENSEKSIASPDSEPVEDRTQDPMQRSLYGDELGSESVDSSMQKSMTTTGSQEQSFEQQEIDETEMKGDNQEIDETEMKGDNQEIDETEMKGDNQEIDETEMKGDNQEIEETEMKGDNQKIDETEMKGDNQPDVVQIQENVEEDINVENQNKVQEPVGEVEEEEISSDDNDSQADVRERNIEDLEDDKVKIEEGQNVNDESLYAFENQAFQQSDLLEAEKSSEPKDTEAQEVAQDHERSPEPQGSESSDEGVVDDKYLDDEECVDAEEKDATDIKESDVGIEVHGEDQYDDEKQQEVQRSLDESHEQFSDSLEVSNIPEAFEKDETPDPREIQSNNEIAMDQTVAQKVLAEETPLESMDPYDPFCSTSPNVATSQTSNPFDDYQGERSSSESPVDDKKPINGFSFDPYAQEQNPFGDVCKQNVDFGEEEKELKTNPFDPEAEWGKPMGLPSPPPPDASAKLPAANGKSSSAKKLPPKPADAAKNGTKKEPPANSKAKAKLDTPVNGPSSKLNTSRTRPASAVESKTKPPPAGKRPATATGSSRASPAKPLPPFTPFYVDLTYIPNHGNPSYSDIEFFKRVRARYYVLSTLSPNPQTLTALMEAKETWDNKNAEVTLIPTYDNDTLRHWMGLHRDKLSELNIDVAPSASRCTIHLQDHETSCSAYRLEF